jgi:hypothetical protein
VRDGREINNRLLLLDMEQPDRGSSRWQPKRTPAPPSWGAPAPRSSC